MLAKLKLALSAIWLDIVDTYKKSKVLILAIVAAIVYFEWERIKAALLVYSGQKELNSNKKEDQALATQENSDIQQANALEQQAQQLPSQEQPVTDDWYLKGDKK